jgi:hypothetical protein
MARQPKVGIERSKSSSRAGGAVGGDPLAYRVARTLILPHHSILDFGSGSHAVHTGKLRAAGHNVTAHDYHAVAGLHDPDALKRRYDMVIASNVLNVQDDARQLATSLNDIANSVNPAGGMAVANFPHQPRYDAWKGMDIMTANRKLENALKRRFTHVERHPMGSNTEPIYILKGPKHHVNQTNAPAPVDPDDS